MLGTTNFVHGIPYVAISIGFTVSRRPTIGVVLNPFTAQLYTGIHSLGSYLTTLSPDLSKTVSVHKLPLYPPQQLDLPSSIVAIEYGSDRSGRNFDVKTATFKNLTSATGGMVHGVRSYGSAALNLCSVASGFIDAYWEGGCWEWDVCAGWVILEEAGGMVVNGNPPEKGREEIESLDLCGRIYLAVRNGQSRSATENYVREFWGLIEGRLEYGR
jgi:myo-inositol-1(or 4)-monophosphatase